MESTKLMVSTLAYHYQNKAKIKWALFAKAVDLHPEALRSRVRRYKGNVEDLSLEELMKNFNIIDPSQKETTTGVTQEITTPEVTNLTEPSKTGYVIVTGKFPIVSSFEADSNKSTRNWTASFILKSDFSNAEVVLSSQMIVRAALKTEKELYGHAGAYVQAWLDFISSFNNQNVKDKTFTFRNYSAVVNLNFS